jgi:hypothetical protein
MIFHPITPNVQESDCGKYRITKSDKGYTSWMVGPNRKIHRALNWIRLDIHETIELAKQECEANNPEMDSMQDEEARYERSCLQDEG